MPGSSNRNYLLTDQYQNSSNLNARIRLHTRFSTNKYDWQLWVFDQFDLPSESRILELGCGPGTLWFRNIHRIPDGWDIILSDFSFGMLKDAREKLCCCQYTFRFMTLGAQAIPFKDNSFDAVIANHMLYHVPDVSEAISESHRVLKPGGRLYAATNGHDHMRELRELARRFQPNIPTSVSDRSFTLENGFAQVSQCFSEVDLKRYEDSLAVTEAAPLVAYVLSIGGTGSAPGEDSAKEFTRFVEQELASNGVINITKDAGIFIARRTRDFKGR